VDVHFRLYGEAQDEASENRGAVPNPRGTAHDDAPGLRIEFSRPARDVVLARLAGAVDLASVETLRADVDSCFASPQWTVLVVDLSDLEFLGVRGMIVLREAAAAAERAGTALRVVACGAALRALTISGLAEALSLYPSAAEACAQAS
jgi:anti-anti-sigma factor